MVNSRQGAFLLFTQLGVITLQGEALLGTGSAVVWVSASL